MHSLVQPPFELKDDLLERLADLVRREVAMPCINVRARQAYTLSSVRYDGALIALPLQGKKRARVAGQWIEVRPGSIFLVPSACTVDIENVPDPATGWYKAVGVCLDEYVLGAARQLLRTPVNATQGAVACVEFQDEADDLSAWLNAWMASEMPRACHALVGAVLKLYARGYHGLMYSAPPSLSARIRAAVAAEPARSWSSAEIETHVGMSGASLRRRLAEEGVSLREIIIDARLSHALSLLTTTRLSVKAVAQRVGYASVSGFSRRFSERYGVDPSRVGTD